MARVLSTITTDLQPEEYSTLVEYLAHNLKNPQSATHFYYTLTLLESRTQIAPDQRISIGIHCADT
eukprot:905317-Amorphochlora_amoeboformis.AAC.1